MYFDTSVILSLYVTDSFSDKAVDFYSRHARDATVSDWVDLEGKSALAVLVRTGRISLEGATLALREFEADRRDGRYRSVTVGSEAFEAGRSSLLLSGALKAGDALHLGIALRAKLPLVTSDHRLHESALGAGIGSTYLPEL